MTLKEKLLIMLKDPKYSDMLAEMYTSIKFSLNEEWQSVNDEVMLSYLKAYCLYCCDNKSNARQQELYLFSLNMGFPIAGVVSEFVDKMNTVSALVGETVNKDRIKDLKRLLDYRDTNTFYELTKSDKTIIKTIKQVCGLITIKELKEGKYQKKNDYEVTPEEIETIEKVKAHPELNQIAHTLYDEKKSYYYKANLKKANEDDIIKNFLITTNKNNPEYNILFNDGTIVNYFEGELRVKPYKLQHILLFTKLFYAANYDSMKSFYLLIDNIGNTDYSAPSKIGKELLMSSISNVIIILRSLEEIYTKKIIDDTREMFVKIKKIAREYDL